MFVKKSNTFPFFLLNGITRLWQLSSSASDLLNDTVHFVIDHLYYNSHLNHQLSAKSETKRPEIKSSPFFTNTVMADVHHNFRRLC